MSEGNPDPKPRSSFLPFMLLIVCVVLSIVVVAFYLPLENCDGCAGRGIVISGLHVRGNGVRDKLGMEMVIEEKLPLPRKKAGMEMCSLCDGEGKVPLLNLWSKE